MNSNLTILHYIFLTFSLLRIHIFIINRLLGRGSDDNVFINIFAARSYNHLKLVFSKYSTQYGRAIETVITSAFGGDFAIILLDIGKLSKYLKAYLKLLAKKKKENK